MPKFRDSQRQSDVLEVTTKQTRRGPRLVQVPVKDAERPIPSPRSASPVKKRSWSPTICEMGDDDIFESYQIPKRTRTDGKAGTMHHKPMQLNDKYT